MFYRLLCYCLLFSAPIHVEAQPYYFRHYQVENGLSNNAVICSLQDKNGFLWFGTKDGLNRFDGYSFKVFRNEPGEAESIGSNFIHCLVEDRTEKLWVGTENGLYRYDEMVDKFYKMPFNEIGIVRDMQVDSENNLWFISNFLLYKYSIITKKLSSFSQENNHDITSIGITHDNRIWISTTNGVLKQFDAINNKFNSHEILSKSARPVWIEKIFVAKNDKMLLATNRGVKLFSLNNFTSKDLITQNSDGTEIFARNFFQTSANEYWIATETGIFIFNESTNQLTNLSKNYNNPYSISDNAVYNICKDKEGGIWVGTYFGGINYLSNYSIDFRKYFPIPNENSLSGNVVREIHEDKNGQLWIGTEDGGLNLFNKATNKFTSYKPSGKINDIAYSNIHGLLVNEEEIWIGTFEHGLDVMNINTGKVIRRYTMGQGQHDLKSNFIYCLHKNIDNEILVGTTNGAFQFLKQKNCFEPIAGLPEGGWYSSLFTENNNNLWAGTYGNGLYLLKKNNGGKLEVFRHKAEDPQSVSSDRINFIFQDNNFGIWIATENGLCKYQKSSHNFKTYNTTNGFPSNFMLSILQDNENNLWVSTTKGLVKFNPSTEAIEVFTKEKGLLNDQFNFNSAYKDMDGTLYFGTVKGFISFNPSKNKLVHQHHNICFTGFEINNIPIEIGVKGSPLKQSIIFTKSIELNYNQSTFSIDFSALSFTSPEMFGYMYKMEGLPGDWTYLKSNRKVFFTELKPGSYKFLVKEAFGSANTPVSSLQITIHSPWWSSAMAKFIYLILISVLAYFIIQFYHRRTIEKHEMHIEQVEIQKSRELYDAKMNFFANITHEIKTPLTLIKGPLDRIVKKLNDAPPDIKKNLAIMERNTERLLGLTTQILDFRQTEAKGFSANFSEFDFSEFLKETLSSFRLLAEQNNISFHSNKIPNGIMAYIDQDAFEKILNNLLSNAIKYAGAKVFFELRINDLPENLISIEIKNDGQLIPIEDRERIFEPFFRSKGSEKAKGFGIGLALAKSLTELHKGSLQIMEDENGMNVFLLTIKLRQDGIY